MSSSPASSSSPTPKSRSPWWLRALIGLLISLVGLCVAAVLVVGLVLVFSWPRLPDISELQEARRELQYRASVQENVGEAVISTDMDLRVRSWNPAAETIYGWTAQEATGKAIYDLLQSTYQDEPFRGTALALLNTNSGWQGELRQRRGRYRQHDGGKAAGDERADRRNRQRRAGAALLGHLEAVERRHHRG